MWGKLIKLVLEMESGEQEGKCPAEQIQEFSALTLCSWIQSALEKKKKKYSKTFFKLSISKEKKKSFSLLEEVSAL